MTIDEMKRRKTLLGLTNEMVAEGSGVPLGTVQKVFGGTTSSPRYATICKLEAYFSKLYRQSSSFFCSDSLPSAAAVQEPGSAYAFRRPDNYTADDYYSLPADCPRVELIEGRFIEMAAPSRIHQGILVGLGAQLISCVDKHAGRCYLYMSPSDVELTEDRRTVVQPDLYIHCHPEKENPGSYKGAPDFIIEILSPSTSSIDLLTKLNLYQKCGVREYWIINPPDKTVAVYLFDKESTILIYTFDDVVPVAISEGECRVDFRKVYARVAHLY